MRYVIEEHSKQLFHRPGFNPVAGQIAVFGIPLQESLAFQVAADALHRQLRLERR